MFAPPQQLEQDLPPPSPSRHSSERTNIFTSPLHQPAAASTPRAAGTVTTNASTSSALPQGLMDSVWMLDAAGAGGANCDLSDPTATAPVATAAPPVAAMTILPPSSPHCVSPEWSSGCFVALADDDVSTPATGQPAKLRNALFTPPAAAAATGGASSSWRGVTLAQSQGRHVTTVDASAALVIADDDNRRNVTEQNRKQQQQRDGDDDPHNNNNNNNNNQNHRRGSSSFKRQGSRFSSSAKGSSSTNPFMGSATMQGGGGGDHHKHNAHNTSTTSIGHHSGTIRHQRRGSNAALLSSNAGSGGSGSDAVNDSVVDEAAVRGLRAVFDQFDVDKDETLNADECLKALQCFGLTVNKVQLMDLFAEVKLSNASSHTIAHHNRSPAADASANHKQEAQQKLPNKQAATAGESSPAFGVAFLGHEVLTSIALDGDDGGSNNNNGSINDGAKSGDVCDDRNPLLLQQQHTVTAQQQSLDNDAKVVADIRNDPAHRNIDNNKGGNEDAIGSLPIHGVAKGGSQQHDASHAFATPQQSSSPAMPLLDIIGSAVFDPTRRDSSPLAVVIRPDYTRLTFEEFLQLVIIMQSAARFRLFAPRDDDTQRRLDRSRATKFLLPDSPVMWVWNVVMLAATVVAFWMATVTHTYKTVELTTYFATTTWVDVAITVVFAADIVVRFFVARVDTQTRSDGSERHVLVDDARQLAVGYLQSYFVLDVLAMLPLRFIFAFGGSTASADFTGSGLIANSGELGCQALSCWTEEDLQRAMMWAKIVAHLRILKLVGERRYYHESGIQPVSSDYVAIKFGVVVILRLVAYVVCFGHLLIVLYLAIHAANTNRDQPSVPYIRGLYIVLMCTSTAGFGDVLPDGNDERIFFMFLIMMGWLANAYFIGGFVSYFQQSDVHSRKAEALVKLQSVLEFFNVPEGLQLEVFAFQDHVLSTDFHALYTHDLPAELRRDLDIAMRTRVILSVPSFRGMYQGTVLLMCNALLPATCVPEEYLILPGEEGEEMFFLTHGFIDVKSGANEWLATLRRGSYFGELAILSAEPVVWTTSVRTLTYCEMLILPRTSFLEIAEKYPRLRSFVEQSTQLLLDFEQAHSSIPRQHPRGEAAGGGGADMDDDVVDMTASVLRRKITSDAPPAISARFASFSILARASGAPSSSGSRATGEGGSGAAATTTTSTSGVGRGASSWWSSSPANSNTNNHQQRQRPPELSKHNSGLLSAVAGVPTGGVLEMPSFASAVSTSSASSIGSPVQRSQVPTGHATPAVSSSTNHLVDHNRDDVVPFDDSGKSSSISKKLSSSQLHATAVVQQQHRKKQRNSNVAFQLPLFTDVPSSSLHNNNPANNNATTTMTNSSSKQLADDFRRQAEQPLQMLNMLGVSTRGDRPMSASSVSAGPYGGHAAVSRLQAMASSSSTTAEGAQRMDRSLIRGVGSAAAEGGGGWRRGAGNASSSSTVMAASLLPTFNPATGASLLLSRNSAQNSSGSVTHVTTTTTTDGSGGNSAANSIGHLRAAVFTTASMNTTATPLTPLTPQAPRRQSHRAPSVVAPLPSASPAPPQTDLFCTDGHSTPTIRVETSKRRHRRIVQQYAPGAGAVASTTPSRDRTPLQLPLIVPGSPLPCTPSSSHHRRAPQQKGLKLVSGYHSPETSGGVPHDDSSSCTPTASQSSLLMGDIATLSHAEVCQLLQSVLTDAIDMQALLNAYLSSVATGARHDDHHGADDDTNHSGSGDDDVAEGFADESTGEASSGLSSAE